jgi:hypothetical protein
MRAALFSLVLLPVLAVAQSWCPPGATWTFGYTDILGGVIGHARVDHTADTVVGGMPAQRLEVRANAYSYPTQAYWNETPMGIYFTTGTSDVVQLWNPNEAAYDTLFWFSAVPGDRWSVPWTYGGVPDFLVLDTLWTTIAGLQLRQVVVGLDTPGPEPIDTLTERLGFMEIFINAISPMFLVDQPFGGLRCYSVDDLQWTDPEWPYGCTSLVGLGEPGPTSTLAPFPNPGTTHFTLDLPPGTNTFTLFDATGRMVLHQRTADARPVIATEALPAGLYRISVCDERSEVMGATWVKE